MGPAQAALYKSLVKQFCDTAAAFSGANAQALASALLLLKKACFHASLLCVTPMRAGSDSTSLEGGEEEEACAFSPGPLSGLMCPSSAGDGGFHGRARGRQRLPALSLSQPPRSPRAGAGASVLLGLGVGGALRGGRGLGLGSCAGRGAAVQLPHRRPAPGLQLRPAAPLPAPAQGRCSAGSQRGVDQRPQRGGPGAGLFQDAADER
eukprot:CAMPEP_0173241988 /NCGR_PEP_ID=MMETSP1142-20121109/14692_1 /TAXON_ID=483371 /ORGANISM="non described non described, Strain CCMP2298" /LENGTH=206 /DNA_ID=CAMNT_0014173411 /DNA_START=245 /DNA_END=862 /DNA_ORIENTATION=-